MENVILRVHDGIENLELPVRDLRQFQGEHMPKLISFFSDSSSKSFSIYVDVGDVVVLQVSVTRWVEIEYLLALGAALYGAGSMFTPPSPSNL